MDNPLTHNPFKNMPKPAVYATVIGGAGITGYLLYNHHKSTGSWNPWSSNSSAGSLNGGNDTDPVTGLPFSQDNQDDPMTGQTYLAEANQYGSVQAAEAAVSAYGQSTATGSGIPVNPASPVSSGTVNTPVGTNVYTSNQAWAQAAQDGLTNTGYDGQAVGVALGDYLTGTPVSQDQASLIRTAIAEYGPPPVGTFQITLVPDKGPGPVTNAKPPTTSPGASIVASTSTNDLSVHWSDVGGADKYMVKLSNGHTATVTTTSAVISVATAGKTGTVEVRAGNAAGWGPYSQPKQYSFANKG